MSSPSGLRVVVTRGIAASLWLAAALTGCGDDGGEPTGSAAGKGGNAGREDAGPEPADRDGGEAGANTTDSGIPIPAKCEVTSPSACTEPAPTFADVQPIFTQRCTSCHSGMGEEWPLTSYSHVAIWGPQIRDAMLKCFMPPVTSGITMEREERELILHWIRCRMPP